MVFLVGASVLNHWSHQRDPRFFTFLSSPMGSTCARVFGWWKSPLERPIADKADHRLTGEERGVKEAIQHAMSRELDAGDAIRFQVTYRDVAFRLEYADEPLYLYPPYAIISQLPAAEMDRTMTAVSDLFDGFQQTFAPLLTRAPDGELIHLLYFASEAHYRDYQQQVAHTMENTSGFYSPARNRLVLYRDPALDDELSLLTIRHEAAHQLFYTYGVHSRHRMENEWLIEGLASYCETPRVGSVDGNQVVLLENARRAGQLIPIKELVNHHDDNGLMAYKPAELAYAQSWSLVHLLMQPAHREAFFAYIRHVRTPGTYKDLRESTRMDVLCRHLELTPEQLRAAWETHLHELAVEQTSFASG